jgi:hypothetical protein
MSVLLVAGESGKCGPPTPQSPPGLAPCESIYRAVRKAGGMRSVRACRSSGGLVTAEFIHICSLRSGPNDDAPI